MCENNFDKDGCKTLNDKWRKAACCSVFHFGSCWTWNQAARLVEEELTQHNHHSVHILFFTCCMFLQIQLDQIVPMLLKKVSNECSTRNYYINRPVRKNCNTSNATAQLTNELIFCSHVKLAPIAGVVTHDSISTPQFGVVWIIRRLCLLVCEQYGSL
jgi:hypothetical protein